MRLAASACSRRERPNTRTCEQGVFAHVRMFACSRRIPASPLEAVLNRRILACSGERTTDSPRARSGRLHSLVLAAPAQRGPEVVPAKSDMRMVLVLLTSLRSFSSFWHGIARKRSLLVLRASVAIKSTEKAATMSRVFCTFFPQKVPIAVCDWCCLLLFGRLLTAVFARGVLCTF